MNIERFLKETIVCSLHNVFLIFGIDSQRPFFYTKPRFYFLFFYLKKGLGFA